ncbi:MAG: HAD hydrolase-like protein [Alphaproteobacteria bacterium]|nr:HAD hydrolase-like protein [Alphaproteobacteria bacterium]
MTFQLFIFDFDGTLADSGPWMFKALNAAAKRYGLRQVAEAEIENLRGRDSRAIIRELGVPMWRLPQIAAYVRQLAKEGESPQLFPGIAEMLHEIHDAGHKLAVVSSNTEEAVRRALNPDRAALFHAYACNASMFGKASKFKRVLKLTGTPPARAIAIGDETRDLEAARTARIANGAVAWGYATPALLKAQAPDYFFETPQAISALLLAQPSRD